MDAVRPLRARLRAWKPAALPGLGAALLVFVLWLAHGIPPRQPSPYPWAFLNAWWLSTTGKFLALAAVLGTIFFGVGRRFQRWWPWLGAAVLLGAQFGCARAAWKIVGRAIPWGFDHPSFMFRLKEFGDIFPFALGGYSPWWNAGTEHFVGVTSGAHGFGVLLWPLLKLWDPHRFYGLALVFWFIFGFPWLAVAAMRSAGVSRIGAICAGFLMCGASRSVFIWAWHFGTVGAMTSAMMGLPTVALAYRLGIQHRGGWLATLALALSAWLMCLWTPGVFWAAGLGLGWLWNARRWRWSANGRLIVAGVLTLALLAPWLWVTFFPARGVVHYVGTPLPRPPAMTMVLNGANRLLLQLQEMHPVVVIFGLLGLLILGPAALRRWLLPSVLILGAMAGWSRELKPLSQLDRLAIPLAVVLIFPAAVWCGRLLSHPGGPAGAPRGSRAAWAAAQGVLLAAILMGLRVVGMHYANEGPAPLRTLPSEMHEFIAWVRSEVPPEGRLGFAGRAVHAFGGGNIAYLPVLTGREMMADDYYGFPRGTIEYNYPPAYYRRSARALLFFSEVYGITHWAASWKPAIHFLNAHPDFFEPVRTFKISGRPVQVFRVKGPETVSRFWDGAGRLEVRENRLRLYPEDPAADQVVIRYNWRDGLVCRTPGAEIHPYPVDAHLNLIAVRPGGNPCVEIGYRPPWGPVKPNFDGRFHH